MSEAYLHYIRRQHTVAEDAPNYDQTRSTVSSAYEYALKECGFDRESGEIWQEYIAYLNEAKVRLGQILTLKPSLKIHGTPKSRWTKFERHIKKQFVSLSTMLKLYGKRMMPSRVV